MNAEWVIGYVTGVLSIALIFHYFFHTETKDIVVYILVGILGDFVFNQIPAKNYISKNRYATEFVVAFVIAFIVFGIYKYFIVGQAA